MQFGNRNSGKRSKLGLVSHSRGYDCWENFDSRSCSILSLPSITFPLKLQHPRKFLCIQSSFHHTGSANAPLVWAQSIFKPKEAVATFCSSLSHLANTKQANGGKWMSPLSGCSRRGPWISLPCPLPSSHCHCNTLDGRNLLHLSERGLSSESQSKAR